MNMTICLCIKIKCRKFVFSEIRYYPWSFIKKITQWLKCHPTYVLALLMPYLYILCKMNAIWGHGFDLLISFFLINLFFITYCWMFLDKVLWKSTFLSFTCVNILFRLSFCILPYINTLTEFYF